jgi:DHA1 family bicyclomycin/chloramphenicol resistance-like MFS transporter
LRLVLILGLLSAIGPFAIDMYLPALPQIGSSLGVFALASVGCAMATSIETLVVLRFIQGLGAAAGMAVPRAVVRDLHTGHAAARMMSLLMLVFSVSPILAPLAGSGVIAVSSWRGVFWAVAVASVIGLVAVFAGLKETRDAAARLDSSVAGALRAYGVLLRDWHYLGLVFIGGCAMAGFFV